MKSAILSSILILASSSTIASESSSKLDGDLNFPPFITLLGLEHEHVRAGEPFKDHGILAYDAEDGDLRDSVIFETDLDTNKVGTYTITYIVTDSGHKTKTAKRMVSVYID